MALFQSKFHGSVWLNPFHATLRIQIVSNAMYFAGLVLLVVAGRRRAGYGEPRSTNGFLRSLRSWGPKKRESEFTFCGSQFKHGSSGSEMSLCC